MGRTWRPIEYWGLGEAEIRGLQFHGSEHDVPAEEVSSDGEAVSRVEAEFSLGEADTHSLEMLRRSLEVWEGEREAGDVHLGITCVQMMVQVQE